VTEAEDMVCLIISKLEPYSMSLKCVELMFPELEGAVDPLFLFVQTMPTLALLQNIHSGPQFSIVHTDNAPFYQRYEMACPEFVQML